MLSFRYSLIFVIMVVLFTSVSFAGQNANAKVALDLYTEFPTNTSNSGKDTLMNIVQDTDIYVKVYLQDVSNIIGYQVDILIDSTKLSWVLLQGAANASEYNPTSGEKNILKKENAFLTVAPAFGSVPGVTEGIYKRIRIAAALQPSTGVTDANAPDGEGLAGLIQLKTKSGFTTSDKARILVKNVLLADNSIPRVEEYGLSNYSIAGKINPVATENSLNTPVEKSIATDTSTISVEFEDGSKVSIKFTSGAVAGKTVTITSMGISLYGEFAADPDKTIIEGKTAAFYNIETNIVGDFTAEVQFTFTAAGLLAAGVSDEPGKLILAYFRDAENNWMKVLEAVIDPVTMTATATISSFSVWAVVDSTAPNVVPVELMSFAARTDAKDGVMLEWATASETNNYGFYIERSIDNENFNQIGFVRGSGNSSKEISYSYIDADVYEVGTYYYRLRQVDFDGKFEYSSIVSVNIKAPDKYALLQAYPNPFNPVTNIEFSLKENGYVRLLVYNTLGQVVQTLVDDDLNAGKHKVTFNAKNLASGVYIYKLDVNGFTDTKKIVLVK